MGRYNFNQRTRDGYEISPEQAAKWLERNDNNRNVNVAKVKKMAKDMREGHWDTTHQGIAIASDGTLVDGQHRLLALAAARAAVCFRVLRLIREQIMAQADALAADVDTGADDHPFHFVLMLAAEAAHQVFFIFAGIVVCHSRFSLFWVVRRSGVLPCCADWFQRSLSGGG